MSLQTESSLTTPQDRDQVNKWKPDQTSPPLTIQESENAIKELNNTAFTSKFPRVDRTYADPVLTLQTIGLVSFIPAKGATPNEKGIYGFAKLRGNFQTEAEASQRAEFLIRNVDSYHQIFHTYVGRPFPLTNSSDYSATTDEIDIRKDTAQSISTDLRSKKSEDEQAMKEIKEREKQLLEESKREEADPYDNYITLRVKKAQLSWTYLEHQKKMAEVKEILIKTRKDIEDLDGEFPEFKDSYYEKYVQARKDAGLKESEEQLQTNFMKYLVEDADLGF
jgi:hypothetical protein